MSEKTSKPEMPGDETDDINESRPEAISRRDFFKTGTAGLLAGAIATQTLGMPAFAGADDGKIHGRRILLKGGVVLTMDPAIGDFEKADVLIEGSKIAAVAPNIEAAARVVDASGTIVMPGFIDTHHHQYETIIRAVNADGVLFGAWPERAYFVVVIGIFTNGRLADVMDLGRSPYDPEDNYISELVASLSQISAGVTTGIDTSQSSHSPEHTDAMIAGLMDSGRRTLFAYSGGRGDAPDFEYPGAIGDSTSGIGRLRRQYFSSDDQLVTLGLGAGVSVDNLLLARAFGAPLVSHAFTTFGTAGIDAVDAAGLLGDDQVYIHTTQFSDETYQKIANSGGHVSIATPIEMSMRHGMPPLQQALGLGVLPSLSTDVETNMAADMFTVMRATFTLQRALLNERFLAGDTDLPPLVNTQQILEMATIAGARAAQLDHKVGSLTPGKDADIIMLDANRINTIPLNNAPGTVVTMMDTSNVKNVFIAGRIKKWNYKLVGVNVDKLRHEVEASRDRVVGRVRDGFPEYAPNLLGPCCPFPP